MGATDRNRRARMPRSPIRALGLAALALAGCKSATREPSRQPPHIAVAAPGDFVATRNTGSYAQQVKEGFRPRDDRPAVRLTFPIDWAMDPFKDRNWSFQLQAWVMLEPIWRELDRTHDRRLHGEALPYVRDWHRYYVREARTSPFQWYDMATGLRAQHLAFLLEQRRSGALDLAPADLAVIDELARLHIEKLRDPKLASKNNHGIFQVHGLRLLCNAMGDVPLCAGEEAETSARLSSLLETQFDEGGVHRENSPSYHVFALRVFEGMRREIYPSVRADAFARLTIARENAPWFTLPNGLVAELGDSSGTGTRFPTNFDWPCQMVLDGGTCMISRDMTGGGYAVVRSHPKVERARSSMLIVTGAAFSTTHDHADELSFELFSGGIRIIRDGGKYGYEPDDWRAWFVSDVAHNVVGLAATSFGPRDTLSPGSALESLRVDGDAFVVRGSVKRGKTFRHSRTMRYLPERRLDIVDDVQAPPGAIPVVRFHLDEALTAEVVANAVAIRGGGREVGRIQLLRGACQPSIVRGRDQPRQGWVSVGYLKIAPATAVEMTCAIGTAHIETRIDLAPATPVAH